MCTPEKILATPMANMDTGGKQSSDMHLSLNAVLTPFTFVYLPAARLLLTKAIFLRSRSLFSLLSANRLGCTPAQSLGHISAIYLYVLQVVNRVRLRPCSWRHYSTWKPTQLRSVSQRLLSAFCIRQAACSSFRQLFVTSAWYTSAVRFRKKIGSRL